MTVTTEIKSFRDIIAWQKGFELARTVYKLTVTFPKSEQYGLTSQLRRAATATPSNIAEGYGRGSTADYIRFLKIARGSLYELDTQLLLSIELGYMEQTNYEKAKDQLDECERVLAALIRSIDRANS